MEPLTSRKRIVRNLSRKIRRLVLLPLEPRAVRGGAGLGVPAHAVGVVRLAGVDVVGLARLCAYPPDHVQPGVRALVPTAAVRDGVHGDRDVPLLHQALSGLRPQRPVG